MIVYIDSNYCCHLTNDGTMRQVETETFDGKCETYINGYRFIPSGEAWTSPSGIAFVGETASPIVNYELISAVQTQYEADHEQMADMQNALDILGVSP